MARSAAVVFVVDEDVVEEGAIMGDRDDGPRIALQELLQPLDRFGVQVVGGFVQQQHVGLGQQQAAQRHAALLAAGQRLDGRLVRLRSRLARSQSSLGRGLLTVLAREKLTEDDWEEIEETLLAADVGLLGIRSSTNSVVSDAANASGA